MKRTTIQPSGFNTILGAILLLFPLFYQLYWIWTFGAYTSQAERVARFQRILPPTFKNPVHASLLFMAFCLLSAIITSFDLKQGKGIFKIISVCIFILASLLFILLLFSLM